MKYLGVVDEFVSTHESVCDQRRDRRIGVEAVERRRFENVFKRSK